MVTRRPKHHHYRRIATRRGTSTTLRRPHNTGGKMKSGRMSEIRLRGGGFRTATHSASSVSCLPLDEKHSRLLTRFIGAKAKDYRIMALLEWRNQQLAANSYRTPLGIDFGTGRELSGLPWGGVDLSVVFSRDRKADAPACCTSSPLTMPTEAFSTCCPPDDQMDAASHWSGWDDTSATVGAYVYKPTAAHDMNTSV